MKLLKFTLLFFFFGYLTLSSELFAWRSTLYPTTWTPGYTNQQGCFLPDFSYAGYMRGELEIPVSVGTKFINVTEAPYNADNTGKNDVTSIIQQAVNSVGQMGGGTVFIPEGIYKIKPQGTSSAAISINYSNVILRGAGKEKTFFYCYEENMRGKKIISISPSSGGNWDQAEDGNVYEVARDIPESPTQQIFLKDVGSLKIGDWVIIRSNRTAEWITEHNMNGFWSADGSFSATMGTTFYRQITGVNTGNRSITIDIPTRYYIKTRDYARVYKVTPKITNVGVENFSIGNKMNSATIGWGEEDYNTSSANGGYQVHSAFLIGFSYCVNSWAKNISSYQAGNASPIHMSSNGIDLNRCRNLTIDRCEFSYPQYEGGGGNGYGMNICSQECLFSNCRSLSPRHAYSFKYAYSSGNVIYNFYSGDGPKYGSDFHMYLSMSNLIDCQGLDGDFIESNVRPYGGTVGNYHGQTSTQTVFWNTNGISYKNGYNYSIDSRQYKYGYVIGTKGKGAGVKTTPLVMSSQYGTVDNSPEDFVEGIGLGTTLEPASLYYDQLSKRLGRDNCLPVFASGNDGNTADNVLDGNLNTRWSVEGKGEFLEFCLGNEDQLVTGVKIAFFNGTTRKSRFDIWYSDTGTGWRVLKRGFESSGLSNEKEEFVFPQAYQAKKIKIIGQGNSLNDWNSYTEVEFQSHAIPNSIKNIKSDKKTFSFFPNPLYGNELTILLSNDVDERNEFFVHITDILGKNVFEKTVITDNRKFKIDNLQLLAGIYIVKLQNSDKKLANLLLVK